MIGNIDLMGGDNVEFLRVIKDGVELAKVIDLPSTLQNRKVEVIIFPYEEFKEKVKSRNLRGVLAKYKNELLLAEEQEAWPRAVKENYEDS